METVNPIARRWRAEATADPEGFWARAADQLPWFRKWDQVFQWDYPTFQWFLGAQTNMSYNCVDRHVENGRGGHAAVAYVNERGDRQVLTYAQLLHGVKQIAAALRGMYCSSSDMSPLSPMSPLLPPGPSSPCPSPCPVPQPLTPPAGCRSG